MDLEHPDWSVSVVGAMARGSWTLVCSLALGMPYFSEPLGMILAPLILADSLWKLQYFFLKRNGALGVAIGVEHDFRSPQRSSGRLSEDWWGPVLGASSARVLPRTPRPQEVRGPTARQRAC